MGNMFHSRKMRKDSINVKQLYKAIKLSKNLKFKINIIRLSTVLTENRIKQINRKTKQTVFTDREKLIALSLYKQGERPYRLLCKIFVLPTVSELHKLTLKHYIDQGISTRICAKLKHKTQGMGRVNRMCVLMFDEVVIAPTINYEQRQYLKMTRVHSFADHVLIFMIRLIFKKKNQQVAYKFSFGRMSQHEMKGYIENVISDLQHCGFIVMATVCDQNARNVAVINALIEETNMKFIDINKDCDSAVFVVNERIITPLYDPGHLMKGIRNDLMKNDLHVTIGGDDCAAKWEHVVNFSKLNLFGDEYPPASDVDRRTMNKMDASVAIRTISDKNGRFMMFGALHNNDPVKNPAFDLHTGMVLKLFGELYSSLSGTYNEYGEDDPLLRPVTPKRVHQKLWESCAKTLQTAKFINKEGKEVATRSIGCWIQTLNNASYLSEMMFTKFRIRLFYAARLNMDPLGKFIKRLQMVCGRENLRTEARCFRQYREGG